jgi:hypothetical protein
MYSYTERDYLLNAADRKGRGRARPKGEYARPNREGDLKGPV